MTYQKAITGAESTAELLELRRDRIRNRRLRKASCIAGVSSADAEQNAVIIEFPTPDFPKIA
ncbi:MAG: hypothetical protein IJ171_03720 [Ruminococcus sp.]|nr:hypothetical protein [Ruminococcus sp.]